MPICVETSSIFEYLTWLNSLMVPFIFSKKKERHMAPFLNEPSFPLNSLIFLYITHCIFFILHIFIFIFIFSFGFYYSDICFNFNIFLSLKLLYE